MDVHMLCLRKMNNTFDLSEEEQSSTRLAVDVTKERCGRR